MNKDRVEKQLDELEVELNQVEVTEGDCQANEEEDVRDEIAMMFMKAVKDGHIDLNDPRYLVDRDYEDE